jgi:hypothetical protein
MKPSQRTLALDSAAPKRHEHFLMLCYSGERRYVALSKTTRILAPFRAALYIALAASPSIAVDSAPRTKQQLEPDCFLALAPSAHSTTIQSNRGEQRAENARRRTTAAISCILPSDISPYRGRGSLVAVVGLRAISLYASDTQSGRSPPVNLLFR